MSEYIDFKDLDGFSTFLQKISRDIGFKVSSRGWCYILEQKRYINKDQFNRATNVINKCRKQGYLPIDFTAEESSREFKGVEEPDQSNIVDVFGSWLRASLRAADSYTPDWWEDEEYYIQMVVEKVDLVTLFEPVCRLFHIPIANSKGWSSMLQRAEYARRFAEAENDGLKCVLLYCGDHDPDGLRISEFIKKNLWDLSEVTWKDGTEGYDPENLIIERFGLNANFINRYNFTWIDNLITGSGRNLASPDHKNYHMDYVQEYLWKHGEKKCEANAIVVSPKIAQDLVRGSIEKFLGGDAVKRFKAKHQDIKDELTEFLDESGSKDLIQTIFERIQERDND